MSKYIYQETSWPGFRWDGHKLAAALAAVHHEQGRLVGRMEGLGFICLSGCFRKVSGGIGSGRQGRGS